MKPYPPRPTRTEMIKVHIFLTLSQLDALARMANRSQTKPNTFLQELIECALLDRQTRTSEPNQEQREQVSRDFMHSSIESDGHSYYSKN